MDIGLLFLLAVAFFVIPVQDAFLDLDLNDLTDTEGMSLKKNEHTFFSYSPKPVEQAMGEKFTAQRDSSPPCINFHQSNLSRFNDNIRSIKLNGNCLEIYGGVGCSGHHLILTCTSNCYNNLGLCSWEDRVSFIKFCNITLPETCPHPKGSQGDLCKDACENHEKNYFSCHLSNGSIDYCSPRPGMDSFGNTCQQNCSNSNAHRCQQNLKNCSWNDVASSFSFSEANFPPDYEMPNGSQTGVPCTTKCESEGKRYFSCDIQTGIWDYCSPRPGMDYMGTECGD
ncbi:unnamed protein product [Allacma fusca]|uniref:Uncharacterized protein n=1 Tax=Allacma fusca TaxID=39272 RepID=A0A8J2PTV5_9HEXA|nr:unnamed protein product [Allacma fusca]